MFAVLRDRFGPAPAVTDLTVEPLSTDRLAMAAATLARAFATNPLNLAAFGPGTVRKNDAFFSVILRALKGPKLIAISAARIVGVIHWVDAPACQFSIRERLRLTPSLIRGVGLVSALRVVSWTSTWSRHDPVEPHVHLGPIGVESECQGRGIGKALMDHYCAALLGSGAAGYLETDRPENVGFYERFGFAVVEELEILGVTNYLMARESPAARQTPLVAGPPLRAR